MEYDNTNSGVLFKNERKDTDKHPDYTGKINVNGTEMRLAAWIREGKSGKFMSLKVSELNPNGSQKPTPKATFDDIPSDLPF